MLCEKSCGAIVYTIEDNIIKYVLVQQKEGFWGFPKGHIKVFETEEGCAYREIGEEVGLSISLHTGFREVDEHLIPDTDTTKQIVYFCGSYYDQKVIKKDDELLDVRLIPLDGAIELLKGNKETAGFWKPRLALLEKADAFIKKEMQLKKEAREQLYEHISHCIPLDKLREPIDLTGTDRPRPDHQEFRCKLEEMMLSDDGDGFVNGNVD